ncbi:hypothetical protein Hanom_Chr01g00067951 [Helianthus anomalus]
MFDLQERLTIIMEGLQKQVDLIGKFDWDFDHHLEEDVPAAVITVVVGGGDGGGSVRERKGKGVWNRCVYCVCK